MERNDNSSYVKKEVEVGMRITGNSIRKCSLQNFGACNFGKN